MTKAALGGLAGFALVLGGTQAAIGQSLVEQTFRGGLLDLDTAGSTVPSTSGAFDSAKARLRVNERSGGRTAFTIRVRNIAPGFTERTFGAHLHTDSCVTDTPGGTGPHYQHSGLDFPASEVWFELVPGDDGVAEDRTVVPFVPEDENGVMSIVIHAGSTDPVTGLAGPKEVCLPLEIEPGPVIETS
jgi:hypothetical protein